MSIALSMHVGVHGKQLLRTWEGLKTSSYLDSGGVPTIGIGHALTRSERTSGKIILGKEPCAYRDGLTEAQCWTLLEQDMASAEDTVNTAVTVSLTQHQFDALVSFCFNVGIGAFLASTLLRLLNQGQYVDVPAQLQRWNRDNGRIVQGLTNRRAQEIVLWNRLV